MTQHLVPPVEVSSREEWQCLPARGQVKFWSLVGEGRIRPRPSGGWIVLQDPRWNIKQTIYINDAEGHRERRCFCHQGKAYQCGAEKMCLHLQALNYLLKHHVEI